MSTSIRQQLNDKEYKNPQFNNSKETLLKMIAYLSNLPLNVDSLKLMNQLVKFYGVAIAVHFTGVLKAVEVQNLTNEEQKIVEKISRHMGRLQSGVWLSILKPIQKKAGLPLEANTTLQIAPQMAQFFQFALQLDNLLIRLRQSPEQANQFIEKMQQLNPPDLLSLLYKQAFIQAAKPKETLCPLIENTTPNNLCCRTFFVENQSIEVAKNRRIQYIHKWNQFQKKQRRKLAGIVCSFLNAEGGTVYFGIRQSGDMSRMVRGDSYTEAQKSKFIKSIQQLLVQILPSIIESSLYSIKFVPVRNPQKPYDYILGTYVAKLVVGYGHRDELYCWKNRAEEHFFFRTQNQTMEVTDSQKILNTFRKRVEGKEKDPYPLHIGACQQPELGSIIYL